MSSENKNFTSSFPMWIAFISCPCLISLKATTFSTRSKRSGENRLLCLVPSLRGIQSSSLNMISTMGFHKNFFNRLIKSPSIPSLMSDFICKIPFCQKHFLHLLSWSYGFHFSISWCGVSYWLTCIYWKILVSLVWILLKRGVWSF